MFDCNIYLCAFLYSLENPSYPSVVSLSNKEYLPLKHKVEKNSQSLKDCLYDLIDYCIDSNPTTVNTFLMDVDIEEDSINIYYTCVLPINSKINPEIFSIPLVACATHPLVTKAIRYV